MKTTIKNRIFTHITLSEVKQHLRINANYTTEDAQLLTLVAVATTEAESYIENRIAFTQLETKIKGFTGYEVAIEEGNLSSVQSVEIDGVAVTDYSIDKEEFWFKIIFDSNVTGDVTVNYTCGFSSANPDVVINQAILIRLADRYEVTRSSFHTAGYATNNAFEMLLNHYKKLTVY